MVIKVTKQYNTVLSQAKKGIPGFANAYAKFIEKVTIGQNSKSLIVNYSRSLAYIALHFSKPPHKVSVDEINAYLQHDGTSKLLSHLFQTCSLCPSLLVQAL